jgi:cystathionine beta-lyase
VNEIKISTPPLSALQGRKSEKWRAFSPDILPMPFAVMDYELAEPIQAALISLVKNSDAGYLGNVPELGQALSFFANQRWGWQIDPSSIKIAPDVGVGVIEICRLILSPGDKILINTPVYYNFYNWIKEIHCEVVDAPLVENELRYALDFSGIEAAYAAGVKVHILCNPHNPVGAVFTKSELANLADLAKQYGVRIMSDEIHAPLVYKENTFTPFLSASENAREVGFAFLSATKTFNIAGLKCAQIVAQSDQNCAILEKLPLAVHSRASLFGAIASAVAYHDCIDWLDALIVELDSSRRFLKELMSNSGTSIGYRMPEAGYFGWLDLRRLDMQGDVAQRFITEGKIAIAPGNFYGPSGSGFIRMNFSTSKEIVQDAVTRIVRTVSSTGS